MKFTDTKIQTTIPTKVIGPIDFIYDGVKESVSVPMATFETPLWYSTKRGSLISQKSDGIKTFVFDDFMTRSIILESEDTMSALKCKEWIFENQKNIENVVVESSRFAKLCDIYIENIAKLLYVRFSIETGNASGHNIVTKAADSIVNFIISHCRCINVNYVSISGNYCVDKKVSAINGILGRGKRTSAEIVVKKNICESILKTSPSKICKLNTKKNLIGSILAGSIRSANAHYANVALAIYLATGQDAANIVEASQGITFAEMYGEDLYFSINMPNIIVGTVGNGKNLDFAIENLALMKCNSDNPESSKRLAAIIAATTLCSEISLLAAQTNQGELIESHIALERSNNSSV